MNPAASDIYPVIDTWPLRSGSNSQQRFDTYGKRIWTDRLTHALLTAALLFPPHFGLGRGMKCGRHEIISLYLYQQTGILRASRQCRSKLHNLFMCEEIKSAVKNYHPAPDASKRDELLVHLLPLVPSLRSAQAERPPTPPPHKGRPYSGPKANFIKPSSGATSASCSLLGYAVRTDPAAIISGAVALELSDLGPRTPVLKVQVGLPPSLNVEPWGGIQVELVVPGTNSVECQACGAFMSLRNRLNAVSSLGPAHIGPKSTVASGTSATRSKIVSRDEVKSELLIHFRSVQIRHEKSGSVSGSSVDGETGGQKWWQLRETKRRTLQRS